MTPTSVSQESDGNGVISISDVTKIYRGETRENDVTALDSIDLDINDGEFVSLVGPSGCGKTTLLRLMSGLILTTEGSVNLRGREIDGPVSDVGFVFQSSVLMDWRTVFQNVMFPYEALKSAGNVEHGRDHYVERANELLELVGLAGFEHSYPNQLSGGMQQRVSICRALLADPPILLMDEPFGALDAFTRDRLNSELLDIWNETGKTIVFVTHNVDEAVFMSDRVVVLSARPGRISSVVDIDLDRPRTLDMRDSEAFTSQVAAVRNDIEVYAQVD